MDQQQQYPQGGYNATYNQQGGYNQGYGEYILGIFPHCRLFKYALEDTHK